MHSGLQIQYIPHNRIDKVKWDACVRSGPGSLIYNYAWCLDAISPQWDALVLNDYETVMPLTWKKKFGLYYLSQPLFTAQTGISGKLHPSGMTDIFLSAIPERFRVIDISLDEKNQTGQFAAFSRKRVNMLLCTTKNYVETARQYHRLATRMVRKAIEEKLQVYENANVQESISFYKQAYAHLNIPSAAFEKAINMFDAAMNKAHLISLAAKKDNTIVGVYLLLQDEHYVYSVMGGSSPEGKETGAFYLLTDYALKIISGTGRLFRFEGSDVPGIAGFNQQFGAIPFNYDHLYINRLSWPLRLFKK